MFEWLFRDKKGKITDILDVISVNMNRIQLAKLAEEKAINMIANAIAKSEIVLSDGKERRKDIEYYRLNIYPNDNQTGTDFWYNVVRKLLKEGDALVVRIVTNESPPVTKYFLADNYTTDDVVMRPKIYSNISITDGINSYSLGKDFQSNEVLHLRYGNHRLRMFRSMVLDSYNNAANALNQMVAVSGSPKFKYKVNANMSFRSKDANGNDVILTIDQVMDKLKKQLIDKDITIIRETEGTSLEYMDTRASIPTNELKNMAEEINNQCAMGFDIPIDVFNGKITEKSDATNEFITYAVQPVAEVITDSLNAKIIPYLRYKKGARAFVWLARFKHVDVIDSANNLDKLRAIGFNFDEILEMVGYAPLNTEFSQARALTKNYTTEGSGEGNSDESAEDPAEESGNRSMSTISKHKERRKKRYERTDKILSACQERTV